MDWKSITAVFLDMDGTLLDLYFDNYFWHEHVPLRFSEKHAIELHAAKQHLLTRYKSKSGTLDWYCVDFWANELDLDIVALKREVSKHIQIFPNVEKFLKKLKLHKKYIAMVTNAHRKSIAVKMDHLDLEGYFDKVISSHDYGHAKEEQEFWHTLMHEEPFDPATTLFIDDNLAVLAAAEAYGIQHLLSIQKPDSSQPLQDTLHYRALSDFDEIMPIQL
ncbi:MAG: GMP/IMP nucleotidase [Gammaproteobacteria bacterium]|nr:MAG: GMP/IMP nucleotidase [Gammaproteobacteria bacterium]